MNEDLHAAILLTQDSLGSLVKQLRFSQKLLERPPVRFLFDIVMEVIRITSFGKTTFTAADCDPASIAVRILHLRLYFIDERR